MNARRIAYALARSNVNRFVLVISEVAQQGGRCTALYPAERTREITSSRVSVAESRGNPENADIAKQ